MEGQGDIFAFYKFLNFSFLVCVCVYYITIIIILYGPCRLNVVALIWFTAHYKLGLLCVISFHATHFAQDINV